MVCYNGVGTVSSVRCYVCVSSGGGESSPVSSSFELFERITQTRNTFKWWSGDVKNEGTDKDKINGDAYSNCNDHELGMEVVTE